ncbi:MAG: efflux RND transporter permease subunit [Candidatus Eisenbacteria bacterium]|nr:efflux RND transporter permease subunit [Candidatus Eisenbacteria bacterium]
MKSLSDFSIAHKTSVFTLCVIIVIMGAAAYRTLPKEASPSITQPLIVVSVAYYGVSPKDMESLVAKKLETKLDEIKQVKELRSNTSEGLVTVEVEFEPNVDIESALQRVRDKVNLAKSEMPGDIEEPYITEISFDDFPIMMLNLSGRYGLLRLKTVAERIQDRIESVPGVLSADISGELEREVQVDVDPVRLRAYDLALSDVIETIAEENLTMPGGSVEGGKLDFTVRVPGEFDDPSIVGDLVVAAPEGRPVYVRDLAEVRYGFKERLTYARQNGEECITVSVRKRTGENLVRIADEVKRIVEEMRPGFPPTTEVSIVTDQSDFIKETVQELENNILSGLVLVVLVLFAFLGFRNSLFVAVAIPLSMLISFLVFSLLGYTLNMIILFSLILALGMLVDNAIVIVENIFRHRTEGYGRVEAASKATNEVALPVVASTITTICAFGPMIFWPGMVGEFMKYLPITLIVTLTSSLFVALVINPTLCSVLLTVPRKTRESVVDRAFHRAQAEYRTRLQWALRHPRLSVGGVFGILILTIVCYGIFGLGVEFFPDTDPEYAYIDVTAPLGTRLEVSDEIVRQIEAGLVDFPDIKQVVATVGSSADIYWGGGGGTPHASRVTVEFLDYHDRSQSSRKTIEAMRERFSVIPGARIEVDKPEDGPPTGAPVDVELLGEDFDVLGRLAKRVREEIKDIPGLVDLKDDFDEGRPEVRVRIDRQKAALYGLSTVMIAQTIQTAVMGTEASKYRVGEDEYDITVRFREKDREGFETLDRITVFYEGDHIPISNFTEFELSAGLGTIVRKNQDRVVSVTAETEGRLPNDVLADVIARLEDFQLPPGYSIRFSGETEDQDEASAFLKTAFGIALLLILLVLISQFDSIVLPLVIIISVLLSFIGVLWGLILLRMPFGIIMTGVGVISLAGVVVNNAIVLIDYIQKLRARGLEKTEAIIQAGTVRLRPVVLTAVTTILGLIPLVTGLSIDFRSGRILVGGESTDWWGPMGVAVIFGLAVSTFLTLIIVPVLYASLTRWSEAAGARVSRALDNSEDPAKR